MIKPNLSIVLIIVAWIGLTGCATHTLGTPCPNFGSACTKTPINSWYYNNG